MIRFCFLVLFAHSAFAISSAQEDRFASCYQLAGKDLQKIRDCQDQEYDAVVSELRAAVPRFKKTIKSARPASQVREEIQLFQLSEHYWKIYSDLTCKVESQPAAEQRRVMMGCLIQMSRFHMDELERKRQNYL